jgi:hypothetical protein
MKENFGLVLEVLNGLRDDVKQARSASRVEYVELREKVDALEEDVRKITQKVKVSHKSQLVGRGAPVGGVELDV